jgi:hypothetical protein
MVVLAPRAFRGPAEAAGFCDGPEKEEVVEVHVSKRVPNIN